MGDYNLVNTKTAKLRKVYKKSDRDYYIFYHRKFYHDDNVAVKIFIISDCGSWLVGVGSHIAGSLGWIGIEKQGLLTPPRTGWEYWDGTVFSSDQSLEFEF